MRAIALAVSTVVFLLSPGLGAYEAFARPIAMRPVHVSGLSLPIGSPVLKTGSPSQSSSPLQFPAQAQSPMPLSYLPQPVPVEKEAPINSDLSVKPAAPLPALGVQVRAAYEQVSKRVRQVSREIGGISNQVNQALSSASPITQGPESVAGLGADLHAILSGESARRIADGQDSSADRILAQARGARGSDQGRSLARPAGKDIQVAVDTYRGDVAAFPPPPSGPNRPTTAEGPGGLEGPFYLKLLAAALVFLPAYFLGVPLAQNGLALEHGIFMHAALAMGLVPFLGASPWKWLGRAPILRRIGPKTWSVICALPGVLLFSMGAAVSLSATGWMGIIAGMWTMLGGWALGKFLLGPCESLKDSAYLHVKRWGAYFSALYVLSGAGLAALYLPGLEPGLLMWLINPLTAFLFHYLPLRSWKFWCALLLATLLSQIF